MKLMFVICLYSLVLHELSIQAIVLKGSIAADNTQKNNNTSLDKFESSIGGCYFLNKTSLYCENCGFTTTLSMIPDSLDLLLLRNVSLSKLSELELNGKSIRNLTVIQSPLSQIHRDDFYGIHNIETLILSENQIEIQNDMFFDNDTFFDKFKDLTSLKRLDLSNNKINLSSVDQYFKGSEILPNLEEIDLSHNPITCLEEGILYPLRYSKIKRLEFRSCLLEKVNIGVFEFMDTLEDLELGGNPSLLKYNPFHPPLSAALFYMPSQNFRYLGLSGTGLPSIPFFSLWAVRKRIRHLDLSMNIFGPLFKFSIFPKLMNLETMKLNSCSITKINSQIFNQTVNLRELNLSYNRITSLPRDLYLKSLLSLDLSYQSNIHLTLFSFDENTFSGMPNLRTLKIKGILSHLDGSVLESASNIEYLDISSVILTSIDSAAFAKAKNLRTLVCRQCWLLETVPLSVWIDLKHLESLDLSYSPKSLLPGNSTSNALNQPILPNIKILNLTCAMVGDTAICDSDDYVYESPLSPNLLVFMTHLEVLILSKNGLTTWHQPRFTNNKNLKYLDISNNKFRSISTAMMEDFKSLDYLNMVPSSDERVVCDEQIVHFFFWAEDNSTSIEIESWKHGQGYFCDDTDDQRIRSFKDYATNHTIIPIYPEKSFLVEGVVAGSAISLFTIFVCVIYSYRQRFYIAFWIMRARRNYRKDSKERPPPPPYYDVFISYSEADSELVTGSMQRHLESAVPRLHSCIHQRDFKVGVSVLENIISSMENSKKILLVLSNGFLRSRWCLFESYVAHHLMKHNLENLVIVVMEKLEVKPDKTISFLLQTRTYIEFSDTAQFWDRLRYAISSNLNILSYIYTSEERGLAGIQHPQDTTINKEEGTKIM